MGALIKRKPDIQNPSTTDVNTMMMLSGGKMNVQEAKNAIQLKPPSAEISPDTDIVKDGVDKVMKKGKSSTIMTGMFGDTSKANTYSKSLLGG